jgi:hypothetical protein
MEVEMVQGRYEAKHTFSVIGICNERTKSIRM